MSTQKSIELTYEAPREQVSAMLRDPEFRQEVCRAQRARDHRVEIDGGSVAITYVQRVSGVPRFARKFVGEAIEVHQDETWDADFTRGELTLTLPGKPGELTGTMALDAVDGRTVETVGLTASVNVPLLGGKLEELILGLLAKAWKKENEVGASWLSRS